MARATRTQPHDEPTEDRAPWEDRGKGIAQPDGGTVAVPEDDTETADGEIYTPSEEEQAAMMRAADYCTTRRYGQETAKLVGYMAANSVDTADLNVVILEQMNARILAAQSHDEILDPFGTVKGADLENRPLWVEEVQFLESDQVDGFPWYANLQVRDRDTGRIIPVTVGGEKLMFKVAGLHMHGMFPIGLKITRTPSKKHPGQWIHDVEPVM